MMRVKQLFYYFGNMLFFNKYNNFTKVGKNWEYKLS